MTGDKEPTDMETTIPVCVVADTWAQAAEWAHGEGLESSEWRHIADASNPPEGLLADRVVILNGSTITAMMERNSAKPTRPNP
jgi:hypothetical protein